MKKYIFLFFLLIIFGNISFAQDSNLIPTQEPIVPFRLFKTTNMWTFILLDTITGKMWQIQYDINGNNRGSVVLNDVNLAQDKEVFVGRFTLYPTTNMWTFILLDQVDGDTWQVQWSQEKENRFVLPIY